MTRDEAIRELGRMVVDEIDRNLPPEAQQASKYGHLLERTCDAFPHTSISELVNAMVGGMRS